MDISRVTDIEEKKHKFVKLNAIWKASWFNEQTILEWGNFILPAWFS